MNEIVLVIRWADGRIEWRVAHNPRIRIGKAADNDIVVPASYEGILDHHAEIYLADETYTVKNLSSTAGLWVDGKAVNGQAVMEIGRGMTHIGSAEHSQIIRFFVQRTGVTHTSHDAVILSPSRPSRPKLLDVLEGKGTASLSTRFPSGQEINFLLHNRVTLVGRSPRADLIIPDEITSVSETHFKVQQTPYGYLLTDLNSAAGTKVNNLLIKPNTPTFLHHRDRIEIADPHSGESLIFTFNNPAEVEMSNDQWRK